MTAQPPMPRLLYHPPTSYIDIVGYPDQSTQCGDFSLKASTPTVDIAPALNKAAILSKCLHLAQLGKSSRA